MGKFENVPELTGMENYYEWRRQTEHLLLEEGVYNHVSTGIDPNDFIKFASEMPQPLFLGAPTPTERQSIQTWIKEDGLTKSIILRKVNSTILSLVPDDVSITACEVWELLASHYDRSDISLQFTIRTQISNLRMKGAADVEKYVAAHMSSNERLAWMGARPSEADAVYALLHGLPQTGLWPVIRKTIEMEMQRSIQALQAYQLPGLSRATSSAFSAHGRSSTSASLPNLRRTTSTLSLRSSNPFLALMQGVAPTQAYTFQDAASTIVNEATQMLQESGLPGPGSKYVNVAQSSISTPNINPETGLRRTKNNPSGTYCTTSLCAEHKRCDHDTRHCYGKGGGLEEQAPWQKKKKEKDGKTNETAFIAAAAGSEYHTPLANSSSHSSSMPAVVNLAITSQPTDNHFHELSCAAVHELPQESGELSALTESTSATILDSGTASHLIHDQHLFWSYTADRSVRMKTANHRSLDTEGYGECIVLMTLGGKQCRVRLSRCLYAPNAMVNLLSVGRMMSAGWELRFKGNPGQCEMYHTGEHLGDIPMKGNLYYPIIEFLRPPLEASSEHAADVTPFTAFTPSKRTWDLWHARMGHLGGDLAKSLPPSTIGVDLDGTSSQSHCDSCILAKHPHMPYPSSSSLPAQRFLELVHSDICGPFPTATLHGKHYFILFLDDHTHVLNMQLLAMRDQAFDAWKILQARWENKFGQRIMALQLDNGGEYMGEEFERYLRERGIEHRKSIPYAHQQNGKVERAVRTIEGHCYRPTLIFPDFSLFFLAF
jgi:hypothetical protein